MYDQGKYGTPLDKMHFVFHVLPSVLACFRQSWRSSPPNWIYTVEKHINGLENTGIYKQLLSYLVKELFLKKCKSLIIFSTNENLSEYSSAAPRSYVIVSRYSRIIVSWLIEMNHLEHCKPT